MSCGMKKMTLQNEAGGMMGTDFYPGLGFGSIFARQSEGSEQPVHHWCRRGTFKDMTDAEAEAICLELATSFLAFEIKNLKSIAAKHAEKYGEDGYFHSVSKKIAALEALTPAAIKL
ncbi:hypothetical protein D3C80_1658230 [compost metagenome]